MIDLGLLPKFPEEVEDVQRGTEAIGVNIARDCDGGTVVRTFVFHWSVLKGNRKRIR